MNENFWHNLPKPFFCLAPMADVTDAAFREIIAKYGKPHVMWTEFVSADGLMSQGREVLLRDLQYSQQERPIVAQLFSSNPSTMRAAAKMCAELGFDGIDINMGCPDKSIEKQGCGAAMIKTPDKALLIIQAAKDGIRDSGKSIPLSVKTRIGYSKPEINKWIRALLAQDIAALTVHCRTRAQLSKVPAQWSFIKEVVDLRDELGVKVKIIGNGDVLDVADGYQKAASTGCDGIMVGRAIFGNPWLFSSLSNEEKSPERVKHAEGLQNVWYQLLQFFGVKNRYWLRNKKTMNDKEQLRVLVEHCELFEKYLGDIKSFAVMKKHFKAYVHGWRGAKELRIELMEHGNSASEVKNIIQKHK